MNTENTYQNLQELIAELSCLLDDFEYEITLEEYDEAEKAIELLFSRTHQLLKLFKLIKYRNPSRSLSLFTEIEQEDTIMQLVELEEACRKLAVYATQVAEEVDSQVQKHPANTLMKIFCRPVYTLTFSTSESTPLVAHTATIKDNANGMPFFQLQHHDDTREQPRRFIFDQLNQCTLCSLSIDEISSITSVGYELSLSIQEKINIRQNS